MLVEDFRKTFCPTIEEKIESFENLIAAYESMYGECATCMYLDGVDQACLMNCDCQCVKKGQMCLFYQYDSTPVEKWQSEIYRLKGDK